MVLLRGGEGGQRAGLGQIGEFMGNSSGIYGEIHREIIGKSIRGVQASGWWVLCLQARLEMGKRRGPNAGPEPEGSERGRGG